MTAPPSKRPLTIPLEVRCRCRQCLAGDPDRRVPVRLCVDWLIATAGLTLPPDTPFQTVRAGRCGGIVVIRWADVVNARNQLRQLPGAA